MNERRNPYVNQGLDQDAALEGCLLTMNQFLFPVSFSSTLHNTGKPLLQ